MDLPSSCCEIHSIFWQIEAMESRIFKSSGGGDWYEERFHSFCDIYLFAAKNGQPIWHYFSRQTDFIDLPLFVLCSRTRRSERAKRGVEQERKRGWQNGGTERPIKLTNANTSHLRSGVLSRSCTSCYRSFNRTVWKIRFDAAALDRNQQ